MYEAADRQRKPRDVKSEYRPTKPSPKLSTEGPHPPDPPASLGFLLGAVQELVVCVLVQLLEGPHGAPGVTCEGRGAAVVRVRFIGTVAAGRPRGLIAAFQPGCVGGAGRATAAATAAAAALLSGGEGKGPLGRGGQGAALDVLVVDGFHRAAVHRVVPGEVSGGVVIFVVVDAARPLYMLCSPPVAPTDV